MKISTFDISSGKWEPASELDEKTDTFGIQVEVGGNVFQVKPAGDRIEVRCLEGALAIHPNVSNQVTIQNRQHGE